MRRYLMAIITVMFIFIILSGCAQEKNIPAPVGKQAQTSAPVLQNENNDELDEAEAVANNSGVSTFNEGLYTYEGEGFSIKYPANARVKVTPEKIAIIGPDVSFRAFEYNASWSGAFYELIISRYANPEGLTAEAWARREILSSWQEDKKRGVPLGAFPVTDDGKIDENLVRNTTIADQPAFRADWFAFDSYHIHYYFATNEQIVVISFFDYPEFNHPLARVQQDIYNLILGTFRFEN